ncbi:MAG: hypothetical protein Fur003_0330 [Candidatus Dojkabacteria bacterium]
MQLPKIKPYTKKLDYSYCFGAYPVQDLFKFHKESVLKVILHSQGETSDGVAEIIEQCKANNVPYEVNDRSISKIAAKDNTYVVGVFNKYSSSLNSNENHIVLDQARNMGNIGTIIRTMVGFGYKNLALIRPSADIFDPKVVRSAMGGLFAINFEYFDSIHDYLAKYGKAGGNNRSLYNFMLEGATEIRKIQFKAPFSLVLGNESQGLGEEYKTLGEGIFIEHSKEIDSLNLSIAAAIAMWHTQNSSK